MKAKTVGAFLSALPDIDAEMESLRARAAKKGCVLRFIARLENGRASIHLTEVDTKHPFYNLSGSDNIISFRTDRYNQRPLVVKAQAPAPKSPQPVCLLDYQYWELFWR